MQAGPIFRVKVAADQGLDADQLQVVEIERIRRAGASVVQR